MINTEPESLRQVTVNITDDCVPNFKVELIEHLEDFMATMPVNAASNFSCNEYHRGRKEMLAEIIDFIQRA